MEAAPGHPLLDPATETVQWLLSRAYGPVKGLECMHGKNCHLQSKQSYEEQGQEEGAV